MADRLGRRAAPAPGFRAGSRRPLYPVFLLGPLLAAWIARRSSPARPERQRFWLWRASSRWPLAALAAPALALASTWYAFNLGSVLRFAWSNAYGEIAAGYGQAVLSQRAARFIAEGLSTYYAVVLTLLGAAAIAVALRRGIGFLKQERAVLLAAWLALPLVAVGLGKNLEIRLLLPLLPAAAMLLAASLYRLVPGRRRAALAAALLAAFPIGLYGAHSLGPAGGARGWSGSSSGRGRLMEPGTHRGSAGPAESASAGPNAPLRHRRRRAFLPERQPAQLPGDCETLELALHFSGVRRNLGRSRHRAPLSPGCALSHHGQRLPQ